MTRQAGMYGITALVGLAVGLAFGVLITHQKVKAANEKIGQLQTEQADMQQKLMNATKELTSIKTDFLRYRDEASRINAELMQTKAENARLKAAMTQTMEQKPASAPATPATTGSSAQPASPSATASAPTGAAAAGVREYTIKEGDSLWNIASAELGKGIRYEEILKLNPQINKNSSLKVGSKIKIPAK